MRNVTHLIYADYNATTPLDPRVLDAMLPYFTERFGNASSIDHPYGHDASVAVEAARTQIAGLIGARQSSEIIFTSGATESDNLALMGVMGAYADRGDHIITSMTEHKAVLDTAKHLECMGKKVTYVPVDRHGRVSISDIEAAITDRTILISIMAANNEIGTVLDINAVGQLAHDNNILFHTDAAQAVGHIPIDVQGMNIDLLSCSAHKMCGPKGIGALYIRGVRPRVRIQPFMYGGGQERSMRPGTLNVPGIVGFGKAAEIALHEMASESERFQMWSSRIIDTFTRAGAIHNGDPDKRLYHTISLTFPGIDGKAIINHISDRIAISAGSACTTQTVQPSHVLLALGMDTEEAHSTIRIGLGRFTTTQDVVDIIDAVSTAVKELGMFNTSG